MARMSLDNRLMLGDQMITRWTEAGFQNHKTLTFVKDMVYRMRNGRGMTVKQRNWYDSAVQEPTPEVHNKELVAQLRIAATIPGMEKNAEVLNDFAYRASRGWTMTENQQNFINRLLDDTEKLKVTGPWCPNPEEKAKIELVVGISRRYSAYYLNGRPGFQKALTHCTLWLVGSIPHLDKWSAEKVMESCWAERDMITDCTVKFPIGSLVETRSGLLCVVMSESTIDMYGQPIISAMNTAIGKIVPIGLADIVRKRKGKN